MAEFAQSQQRPREERPSHQFRTLLRRIQDFAKGGDINAWNAHLPLLSSLALKAGIDPQQHLDTQVQLRKLELDLLLHARERILEEVKILEEKAEKVQPRSSVENSDLISSEAKKLKKFADWLQVRLVEKTNLILGR